MHFTIAGPSDVNKARSTKAKNTTLKQMPKTKNNVKAKPATNKAKATAPIFKAEAMDTAMKAKATKHSELTGWHICFLTHSGRISPTICTQCKSATNQSTVIKHIFH